MNTLECHETEGIRRAAAVDKHGKSSLVMGWMI